MKICIFCHVNTGQPYPTIQRALPHPIQYPIFSHRDQTFRLLRTLTVETFNCSISYVSGLYKMTVQDNPLTYLNDDSLYGLDRSLWELELVNTRLTYVPSRAIRTLQKLKILNLSGTYESLDAFAFALRSTLLLQVTKYRR